jgi:hypothetical protein
LFVGEEDEEKWLYFLGWIFYGSCFTFKYEK